LAVHRLTVCVGLAHTEDGCASFRGHLLAVCDELSGRQARSGNLRERMAHLRYLRQALTAGGGFLPAEKRLERCDTEVERVLSAVLSGPLDEADAEDRFTRLFAAELLSDYLYPHPSDCARLYAFFRATLGSWAFAWRTSGGWQGLSRREMLRRLSLLVTNRVRYSDRGYDREISAVKAACRRSFSGSADFSFSFLSDCAAACDVWSAACTSSAEADFLSHLVGLLRRGLCESSPRSASRRLCRDRLLLHSCEWALSSWPSFQSVG